MSSLSIYAQRRQIIWFYQTSNNWREKTDSPLILSAWNDEYPTYVVNFSSIKKKHYEQDLIIFKLLNSHLKQGYKKGI